MKITVVNVNDFSFPKFNAEEYFKKHKTLSNNSVIECEGKKLLVANIMLDKEGNARIEAI